MSALLDRALEGAFAAPATTHRKSKGGVTMSGLGGCRRRAAYLEAGVEPEPTPPTHRSAPLGTWIHDGLLPRLVQALPGAETEVGVRWEWTPGRDLFGRLDLYHEPSATLIDLKTVGEWGLSRARRDGIPRHQAWQTHGYSAALLGEGRPVEWVEVLYLDRASGEHEAVRMPYDPEVTQAAADWMGEVVEYAGTDPDRAPRDERGPGLSFVCDGCPFLHRCWGEGATSKVVGAQAILAHDETGEVIPSAVESAAAMYADASARAKSATEDKAFARAVLTDAPPGVYGEWKVAWRKGSRRSRLDVEEATRLLTEHSLPVPMAESLTSPALLITPA